MRFVELTATGTAELVGDVAVAQVTEISGAIVTGRASVVYGDEITEVMMPVVIDDQPYTAFDFLAGGRKVNLLTGVPRDQHYTQNASRRLREYLRSDISAFTSTVADVSARKALVSVWEQVRASRFSSLVSEAEANFTYKRRNWSDLTHLLNKVKEYARSSMDGSRLILPIYSLEVSDIIIIDQWLKAGRPGELLFLLNTTDGLGDEGVRLGLESRSRRYLDRDVIIAETAEALDRDLGLVQQVFSIYNASIGKYLRTGITDNSLTIEEASNFIRVVNTDLSSASELREQTSIIPSQKAAPIRFNDSGAELDILDAVQYELNDPRIRGAARALTRILNDFTSSNRLSNVSATLVSKADRVSGLLSTISSGVYDDGTVVELGMEVVSFSDALDALVANLSEETLSDAAAFVVPAFSFLDQFDQWSSFDTAIEKRKRRPDGPNIEALARDLLGKAAMADSTLMTDRAKSRVSDMIEKDATGTAAAKEGVSAASENLTSAIARRALSEVENEAGETIKEALSAGRRGATSLFVSWIAQNHDQILAFAQQRGLVWLLRLLHLWNS